MRKSLCILLFLFLALGVGSMSGAEDGFYVIPSSKTVAKTGQTISYGARDDGALQKGVAPPSPRFTDNGNGTVTDNLTKLIWTKNAVALGTKNWSDALTAANNLASGATPGLEDGSQAGDWRLPNLRELQSLVDYGRSGPALPAGHPFQEVQSSSYWSSTTYLYDNAFAWSVYFFDGSVYSPGKGFNYSVWCVRGGP